MKRIIKKVLLSLIFVICLIIPQNYKAYDFVSRDRENNVKNTRKEIYDLYNMYKDIIRGEEAQSNEFGVYGYNGVCQTVTVNGESMSLDDYVAGVVKSEAARGNLESLKAQAIAARSFLLYNKRNATTCVIDNTSDSFQVFKGRAEEDSDFYKAAKETSNMVVVRDGKIALTQYQSYPAGQFQVEDATGWHVKFQRFNDDPSTEWVWDGPPKSEVLSVTNGVEMDYYEDHHYGMSQTISAYLALKENYDYEKIIKLFYNQPIVRLTDGVYDSNLEYYDSNFGKIIYWNQNDYKNEQYGHGCGSIAACGCGPTSVAIVASSMLNRGINPVETTQKVCDKGGCTASGSIMDSLRRVLVEDYGLKARYTKNNQEILDELKTGNSLVIVLMGDGIFTSGGHYIVLTGVNEKRQVSVADPASRNKSDTKWFDFNIIIEQRKYYADFLLVTR